MDAGKANAVHIALARRGARRSSTRRRCRRAYAGDGVEVGRRRDLLRQKAHRGGGSVDQPGARSSRGTSCPSHAPRSR